MSNPDPGSGSGPEFPDDGREEILRRDGLMLGVVLFSLVSGMHFSPLFDYVWVPLNEILGRALLDMKLLVFYLTSLLLTTTTFMLSGIPAAIFERQTGRQESDVTSLTIWLAGAAILSLPSFMRLAGAI